MNRLIIIGNGFDLSLKLKTSYNHFLTHYIQELVIGLFETSKLRSLIIFDQKLGNTYQIEDDLILIKLPEYFFRDSKKGEEFLKEIKNFEVFKEIISYLTDNGSIIFKSVLLKEIYQNSYENWIDIEILYFESMISIYRRYEGKPDLKNKLRQYNDNFQHLKTKLIEYLSRIKLDLEKYNLDFYVDNFIEKLITPYNNGNRVNNILFLNFNYTRTLEEIRKYYLGDKKLNINYIHGNVNDPSSIIFGFGDESDKNYIEIKDGRINELHENIKRFHYYKENKYDELKSFLNSEQFEVWIIGHSCGTSDKTIIREIVENENCDTIRIFHFNTENPKQEFHQKSIELMKSFSLGRKIPKLNFDKNDIIFQLNLRKI